VILFQGRESFDFVGWQWGFHISMAFNAAQSRPAPSGLQRHPTRDHGWPAALIHKSCKT
jgi:hypothetical protein